MIINAAAQEVIEHYKHLKLGGKSVVCPYYMNLQKKKDLRVMVGKGTPEEIEMEAKIWAKLKGANFEEMSELEIKKFLLEKSIGIDCSGFVMHVLNNWYKDKTGKEIWSKLKIKKTGLMWKIAYMLRPVEKLGAEIITSEPNAYPIEIKDVKPGDLVRTKWKRQNAHHVLLVTKVERNEKNEVSMIEYTHSTPFFGDQNGIRVGEIVIKNQNNPLEEHEWLESDENGNNYTFEGYMINLEDNGLRRLKAMEKII